MTSVARPPLIGPDSTNTSDDLLGNQTTDVRVGVPQCKRVIKLLGMSKTMQAMQLLGA